MAAPRLACRALLRRARLPHAPCTISTRSLITVSSSSSSSRAPVARKTVRTQQQRALSSSAGAQAIVNQDAAPVPKVFAEAATVGKNLVDVKKVLVIGSGGLAIGQAGEFDYSGMAPDFCPRLEQG